MAIKTGKYYICDRCGKTKFAERIGKEEGEYGYTTWDVYAEMTDWNEVQTEIDPYKTVLLCPECSTVYSETMKQFMNMIQYIAVPYKP